MPFIAEIALLLLLFVAAGAALVGLIALAAFVISTFLGRNKGGAGEEAGKLRSGRRSRRSPEEHEEHPET
jgi:hypothetical protein